MSLAPGARLGPYKVLSAIGAGGMGEVYRARDTRLGRDVAIKVLPEPFANDLDRLARFKREAQVLASLNHPHIAQIHGLEETSNGSRVDAPMTLRAKAIRYGYKESTETRTVFTSKDWGLGIRDWGGLKEVGDEKTFALSAYRVGGWNRMGGARGARLASDDRPRESPRT